MITLFGAPGSGKSEQGKLLSKKYGWRWLDMRTELLKLHDEDITRALEIGMSVDDKKATEVVRKIIQKAKDGKHSEPSKKISGLDAALVDESLQMILDDFPFGYSQLLSEEKSNPGTTSVKKPSQVILDGFPFDYNQVKWMIDNGQIKDLQGVIVLQVPRGQIWQRLVQRKRVDDTRAAIERREDIYDRTATGMIKTLSANGVQIGYVDGVGAPEDVLERIEEVLGDWGLVPKKQYDKISMQHEMKRSNLTEAQLPDFE